MKMPPGVGEVRTMVSPSLSVAVYRAGTEVIMLPLGPTRTLVGDWVDDAWVDDARVDDARVDDARVDDAWVVGASLVPASDVESC